MGQIVLGLMIPFIGTTAGAGCVFFLKNAIRPSVQKALLGFASGVMVAASVWSLLIPAMDMGGGMGRLAFVPAAVGFLLGIGFLLALDRLIPHLHLDCEEPEGPKKNLRKSTMLVLAVTLHNIPEGMAVGLSFAMAAQHGGDSASMAAAMALALGMGIQNFPEGAAVSLPLRQEGVSSMKACLMGSLSGIVELIFGVLVVLVAGSVQPLMPWMLSFAAGAMLYVVVEELIPEAHLGEHSHPGTIGVLAGFLGMMILDTALG